MPALRAASSDGLFAALGIVASPCAASAARRISPRQARFRRAARLAVIGLALGGAAPAAALDMAALRQGLKACHGIADAAARVRCYDRLAEMDIAEAPSPSPQAPASLSQQAPAQQVQPPAAPAEAQVTEAQATTQAQALPQEPKSDITSILFAKEAAKAILTAKSIGETRSGLLRVVTIEGIVLEQARAERLFGRPQAGDKIIVTRSFIGGHWCRTSERDMFRCTATRAQGSEPAR